MKRGLTVIVLVVFFALRAHAYTLVLQNRSGQFIPLRWPISSLPVHFAINQDIGPELPNVTDDSDPRDAIDRALAAWPSVAAITVTSGTTSVASGGRDGVNLISFADTAANRKIFETAGGALALTLFFFDGTALEEADILMNPDEMFATTVDSQAELDAAGLYDVEGQVLHELGHAFGLDHSGVEAAAMWPIASLAQRQLDADDVAGARALYPTDGDLARIAGTVLVDGSPAFGAQVVALSADGVAVSTLTRSDGTYIAENLAPGSYTLYAEPLDGPQGVEPSGDCITFGSLSGSGIYGGASLTTDFTTAFLGGAGAPTVIVLSAGETAVADLDIERGASSVNPTLIGSACPGTESFDFSLGAIPQDLAQGSRAWVTVAGPGLESVDGFGILVPGAGVEVDPTSSRLLEIACNGQPLPMLLFQLAVADDALPGNRTLLLASEDGGAALTGAFRVREAPEPPVCAGDCDGNATVTVAELTLGINIALGTAGSCACPAFDVDSDGEVSVDELVTAINFALAGCPPESP